MRDFFHSLQYQPERSIPADWQVDWEHAPLPYKLYQKLPTYYNKQICSLLQSVYGLTSEHRRNIPSGGALYPNELYISCNVPGLLAGIYHYDAAHDRLVLLREGAYGSDFTLFVSVLIQKNFFKYHNFSYRLQGLDTGILIGKILAETHETFVSFQFADRELERLIGLKHGEEYIAATLSFPTETITHPHYLGNTKTLDTSLIQQMNHLIKDKKRQEKALPLPVTKNTQSDIHRYSPGLDFIYQKLEIEQLAKLLTRLRHFSYDNDIFNGLGVSVYLCVFDVDAIPNGGYFYDKETHSLQQLFLGDWRMTLQKGLTAPVVNFYQVPICVHIAGKKDFYREQLGVKGYRIVQMAAGIVAEQLLLGDLQGHPLLGFDPRAVDDLYQLTDETILLSLPLGTARKKVNRRFC